MVQMCKSNHLTTEGDTLTVKYCEYFEKYWMMNFYREVLNSLIATGSEDLWHPVFEVGESESLGSYTSVLDQVEDAVGIFKNALQFLKYPSLHR